MGSFRNKGIKELLSVSIVLVLNLIWPRDLVNSNVFKSTIHLHVDLAEYIANSRTNIPYIYVQTD